MTAPEDIDLVPTYTLTIIFMVVITVVTGLRLSARVKLMDSGFRLDDGISPMAIDD